MRTKGSFRATVCSTRHSERRSSLRGKRAADACLFKAGERSGGARGWRIAPYLGNGSIGSARRRALSLRLPEEIDQSLLSPSSSLPPNCKLFSAFSLSWHLLSTTAEMCVCFGFDSRVARPQKESGTRAIAQRSVLLVMNELKQRSCNATLKAHYVMP